MRRRLGMKPSGRSTIITSSRKPKIPNEIDVTSKSSPIMSGTPLSSGSRKRLIIDSATAPTITPARLPMPPRMIMQRMNTEKPNSNWSTLIVFWKTPRNTPAKPPIDAPIA